MYIISNKSINAKLGTLKVRAATTAALSIAEKAMSANTPAATPHLEDSSLSVKDKVQLLTDMPAAQDSAKVFSKCSVCSCLG